MFYEAFIGGIWVSVGSTLGKLSGNNRVVGDSYLIWGGILMAMVLVNTWGSRYYLRSLDAAANSVAPTVISAATSFILSGILGILLFDEGQAYSTVRWWVGAFVCIIGLALLASENAKQKKEHKKA